MATRIRALVVDDSQVLRKSIVLALERLGTVVCTEATDGADALKKLAAESFDLVLTDINMPLMDGLKLIAHLRQGFAKQDVPIIVISTESAEVDRQRALALGANAYLVKPVQAKQVLDTVKGLLGIE